MVGCVTCCYPMGRCCVLQEEGKRSQDDVRLHLIVSIFMVKVLQVFKCSEASPVIHKAG